MSNIVLSPAAAVDVICSDEQLRKWGESFVDSLCDSGLLRKHMDVEDFEYLSDLAEREIKSIIKQAFNHPEARTIKVSVFR